MLDELELDEDRLELDELCELDELLDDELDDEEELDDDLDELEELEEEDEDDSAYPSALIFHGSQVSVITLLYESSGANTGSLTGFILTQVSSLSGQIMSIDEELEELCELDELLKLEEDEDDELEELELEKLDDDELEELERLDELDDKLDDELDEDELDPVVLYSVVHGVKLDVHSADPETILNSSIQKFEY